MNATQKYLQPQHSIFGEQNFDEYCSNIPQFYFKKEVPEDVIQEFMVIEKLMALSYYEHKFIDVAYMKAIRAFEMAMTIRCRSIFNDSKKRTFRPLINDLSKKNLFDTNIRTLEWLNDIRNIYTHPEMHIVGGIFNWNRIEIFCRLINEMYEDVGLRLQRQELFKNFIRKQQNAHIQTGLVMYTQDQKMILHSLQLLLINNKQKPHAYVLACTPLFDLTERDGSIKVPFVFKSKLISPIFPNSVLEGEDFATKQKIIFNSIRNYPELLPEFEAWNIEYQTKNKFHFESSQGIYTSDFLVPEFQAFQKM